MYFFNDEGRTFFKLLHHKRILHEVLFCYDVVMKALVTNDDGYMAIGINALLTEASKEFDTIAVAPLKEQSWVSKSITRHRELTMEQVEHNEFKGFAVDGTPADCAQLGIFEASDRLPDLVISGINNGSNVGPEEILSSGTVGAALEASLQGIPAFATSVTYIFSGKGPADFNDTSLTDTLRVAAEISCEIIKKVMQAGFPPNVQVISINMPSDVKRDAKWCITTPHTSRQEGLFAKKGDKYKHQGSTDLLEKVSDNSDLAALEKGYVSIVPLNIQLTDQEGQQSLAKILDTPILGD